MYYNLLTKCTSYWSFLMLFGFLALFDFLNWVIFPFCKFHHEFNFIYCTQGDSKGAPDSTQNSFLWQQVAILLKILLLRLGFFIFQIQVRKLSLQCSFWVQNRLLESKVLISFLRKGWLSGASESRFPKIIILKVPEEFWNHLLLPDLNIFQENFVRKATI